jgi:hypothetical protein
MAHMSIIYIVEEGEASRGISSYAGFSTLKAAQAEALRRRNRYRPNDWAADSAAVYGDITESWVCGGPTGCDYINVRHMEVN